MNNYLDDYLNIGIDDTDSPRKGCTTYIAALATEYLEAYDCVFIDYPNLIRLNPTIPWKTRGNGAIALRIHCPYKNEDAIKDTIIKLVKEHSDVNQPKTDPAIAFYKGLVPKTLQQFSKKAVQEIISISMTKKIANDCKVELHSLKGEQGIVGALAAVGATLEKDYTYELIAYRKNDNFGKPRKVDKESVLNMDKTTYPLTFNNYDYEKARILITPHGPDPVLFGIRGESPAILLQAYNMITTDEPVSKWIIFRSNQGTDMHLKRVKKITNIKPYTTIQLIGEVSSTPKTITGGHVIVTLSDGNNQIDCAAYEPTGSFRKIIRQLIPRDVVLVTGGIRLATEKFGKTINLEKIKLIKIVNTKKVNPLCDICHKRMESAGKGQGFRCKRCRTAKSKKTLLPLDRNLKLQIYTPTPSAHRHLTKPLIRYGKEKTKPPKKMTEKWNFF